MTETERRDAVIALLRKRTAEHTHTKEAARKVLVEEGFYTAAGELKAAFGGKAKGRNSDKAPKPTMREVALDATTGRYVVVSKKAGSVVSNARTPRKAKQFKFA